MELNRLPINQRVDFSRIEDAYLAADYLANNFIETGRFVPRESWGPEGTLYLSESAWALMDAYTIGKKQIYLQAVVKILNELKSTQKESGGWSIDLLKSGVGFKINEEQSKDSQELEDLPTTAAILKTIAEYQIVSNDFSFVPMGEKAFDFLMSHWDSKIGTFVEHKDRLLLKLRANPRSYHLFFLLGISAWENYSKETVVKIYPQILEYVKGTLESYDAETMPLIYGLHASVLMHLCSKEYIQNVIKPRIDQHLVNNSVFCLNSVPGGYGHRDGSRGIVTNEAHMRSAVGVAFAMRTYDLISQTHTYQNTAQYTNISQWIDQMKAKEYYYEYELLPERTKKGFGSPGQYLPCFWIFGRI